MKAHGGRWEGEREEARLFPRPIVPRALCIFFIIAIFFWDTQREPLKRIEYLTQLLTLNLHVK